WNVVFWDGRSLCDCKTPWDARSDGPFRRTPVFPFAASGFGRAFLSRRVVVFLAVAAIDGQGCGDQHSGHSFGSRPDPDSLGRNKRSSAAEGSEYSLSVVDQGIGRKGDYALDWPGTTF